ncbi:MAG TPA: hypothetical protein VG057_13350 [Solirubrobacteraceae bacterium]|jgi:hypothetical protein|nr:hypothetical protein [Solirubrobacteraceae bacterium]
MLRLAVGLISLVALAFLLAEFFIVFLLPRRVRRDPAIARAILRTLWIPWRAGASLLRRDAADTMLGIFGPLGLVAILGLLSIGVVLCYTGLYWATSTHVGAAHPGSFGDCLYFSAGAFVSATTATPSGGLGKLIQIVEAANGLGFLAIAIGYLPALFQAFSRRESAVARLDPRAGSPPSPGRLLERTGERGGWAELDEYLLEWETWTAELMETHLSYPILGYFRSQHVNQNWLAALTTIVDASAYALAFGPKGSTEGAELTFRIGSHALGDLAYTLSARRVERDPEPRSRDRLPPEDLAELRGRLEGSGLHSEADEEACAERLGELRAQYEPFAIAMARHLALDLPDWLPGDEVREEWQAVAGGR